MENYRLCSIRLLLQDLINTHIHPNSVLITAQLKIDIIASFILDLRLHGILHTTEEIERVKFMASSYLDYHQQLQQQYGLEWLKYQIRSGLSYF